MDTQTAILEFVSSVRKNLNESGILRQEQARLILMTPMKITIS